MHVGKGLLLLFDSICIPGFTVTRKVSVRDHIRPECNCGKVRDSPAGSISRRTCEASERAWPLAPLENCVHIAKGSTS